MLRLQRLNNLRSSSSSRSYIIHSSLNNTLGMRGTNKPIRSDKIRSDQILEHRIKVPPSLIDHQRHASQPARDPIPSLTEPIPPSQLRSEIVKTTCNVKHARKVNSSKNKQTPMHQGTPIGNQINNARYHDHGRCIGTFSSSCQLHASARLCVFLILARRTRHHRRRHHR